MRIKRLEVGEMGANCYLVWDPTTATQSDGLAKGVVIDPGDEGGFISEQILKEKIEPVAILLTHGHFDHMMGALEIKLNFPYYAKASKGKHVPIYLQEGDLKLFKSARESAKHWLKRDIGPVPEVDKFYKTSWPGGPGVVSYRKSYPWGLSHPWPERPSIYETHDKEGEGISFGKERLLVIETPGHTPGSICLVGKKVIFTGDTLFADGVGRTDFSYSKPLELVESLEKIKKYSGFIGYPGHGEEFEI